MKHVLRVFAESKLRALEAYCVWLFFFFLFFFSIHLSVTRSSGQRLRDTSFRCEAGGVVMPTEYSLAIRHSSMRCNTCYRCLMHLILNHAKQEEHCIPLPSIHVFHHKGCYVAVRQWA